MTALLALRAFGGFLKGLPWQLYAALAAIALIVAGWFAHTHAVSQARKDGLREGAQATAKIFHDAQAEADRLATVEVQLTVKKQDAITQEVSDARDHSVSDIHSRADAIRLRHDAATAQRAARRVDLPPAGEAAGEPAPAPYCDGLPWDVAFGAMTQAELQQDQLNKILDFEEAQDALAAQEETPVGSETPQ